MTNMRSVDWTTSVKLYKKQKKNGKNSNNTAQSLLYGEEGDALVVVICCTFIVALTPFMGAR